MRGRLEIVVFSLLVVYASKIQIKIFLRLVDLLTVSLHTASLLLAVSQLLKHIYLIHYILTRHIVIDIYKVLGVSSLPRFLAELLAYGFPCDYIFFRSKLKNIKFQFLSHQFIFRMIPPESSYFVLSVMPADS